MNVKIINNPSSGRTTIQKNIEGIVGRLVLEGTFERVKKVDTTVDFDYRACMESAKADNVDMVMAIGGDGTVNRVVNGMMNAGLDVPLVIVPAGTVNDFATYLDLPSDIEGICRMIKKKSMKRIDVCRVNEKYFINIAACGLFTDVALKTNVELKTMFGRFAYYAEGIKEIPKQIFQSLPMKFSYANEEFEENLAIFAVVNTPVVGGFKKFAPEAKLDDNMFDVIIIKKTDIIDTANLFLKILRGDHLGSDMVRHFQTDRLYVESVNEGLKIDIDGEDGGGFPAEFTIVSAALDICIP